MTKGKVVKIDFSQERLLKQAERFCEEGDFLSALRFARFACEKYDECGDAHVLLADIYERLGLNSSALNEWFRFLDRCAFEDLPDAYEGIAVNYLNLGNEKLSQYYYNQLVDVDETITNEGIAEINQTFQDDKKGFRFVYPPELSDFKKEMKTGRLALKNGELERAVEVLSKVEKGSKEYAQAMEMQAVARLLEGKKEEAEKLCLTLLEEKPNDVQALATLSAVYTEQGRRDESRKIAQKLCSIPVQTAEERYKIATVACENDLHEEAYRHFCLLEKDIPYDGNMLYFKGVSAFLSGHEEEGKETFEKLCDIYPDAVVAKYYLNKIKRYLSGEEEKPELVYYYRLPEKEREKRCESLLALDKMKKEEREIVGGMFNKAGYFTWCFDEMDGMQYDLQFLGSYVAVKSYQDDFIRDVLLDIEVRDVLKVELLRALFERNEEDTFGAVICGVYREIHMPKLSINGKQKKKFIYAFSECASKFGIFADGIIERLQKTTEALYKSIQKKELWNLCEKKENLVCALYLLCGLKQVGKNSKEASGAFKSDAETVDLIMANFLSY